MPKVDEARIRLTDTLTSEQCRLLADYIHELANELFRKEHNV
jgi:hypothetical protein